MDWYNSSAVKAGPACSTSNIEQATGADVHLVTVQKATTVQLATVLPATEQLATVPPATEQLVTVPLTIEPSAPVHSAIEHLPATGPYVAIPYYSIVDREPASLSCGRRSRSQWMGPWQPG
ncbi:hypothetical protein PENSPDRAFT_671508 [Peniophora sp. CONT]|nr:hypothetical protein PENSPDRAFT_671508 [Peniophora sp. CONT]